jgi:predicted aconitase
LQHQCFLPVLGAWYGAELGETVGAIVGLAGASEDGLKAFGAAAASTGAIGLYHIVGCTPEAPSLAAVLQGKAPERRIIVTHAMLRAARDRLSSAAGEGVSAVAVGSPHFSLAEFDALQRLLPAGRLKLPFYACTGRHVLRELERQNRARALAEAGVKLVVDTCVVVAPIMPTEGGVLLTNSAKFAHYAPGAIGYQVLFGSLADCVATAAAGRLVREEADWW